MKTVLLHICCGVCGIYSLRKLKNDGFSVKGFFYNPNIHPQDEYARRKEVAEEVCRLEKVDFLEKESGSSQWHDLCSPYANQKEGDKRCALCYELRLKETFKEAKAAKFDYIATTLTISPYKKSKEIFEIGKSIAGDSFLAIDFKKKDGFKKTIALAK